ncbi:MAG: hypothetical protein CK431_10275 [Mycobacterium sp.]|nr:MAG: hypothetical protein CK431_10275 [Mycobacterium sp.]
MSRPKADVTVTFEPVFIDKPTAARALGNISVRKLEELIRAGRINPQVIDGRTVLTPDELRRFATACPSWEPAVRG